MVSSHMGLPIVTLCYDCHEKRHGYIPTHGELPNHHQQSNYTDKFIRINEVINYNKTINNARKHRIIEFGYTQSEGFKSIRAVLPKFTYKKNINEYLYGYCYLRKARKEWPLVNFRLDKMCNMKIINKHEIPKGGGKRL